MNIIPGLKTIIFCCLLVAGVNAFAQRFTSQKISINSNWQFSKIENNLSWEKIDLPHTWNVYDVIDEVPGYYRGKAFYKKEIEIPANMQGKKIYLQFEGANTNTKVFINKKIVGKHVGGYSSFSFEITPFLNLKGVNELIVEVDNSVDLNDLPVSADFTFYGGIYRDVFLISKDDVHFDLSNYGSSGVFVNTPSVSKLEGNVVLSGTINNDGKYPRNFKLLTEIKDARGKVVFVKSTSKKLTKDSNWNFKVNNIRIPKPNLWSPDNPYLYSVNFQILDVENNNIIDASTQPLGFRWFEFNADKGFFLNGDPLKLIGTNRHQDREGFGNALPDDFHEEDIRLIKEMGANFLRIAHYPQDPRVLEMCDRYGLLVWEEIPVVNEINTTAEFAENAKMALKEMIRQNFNHPSIIIWGFMNEIFATNKMRKLVERETLLAKTTSLAKELQVIVRQEDPSRNTAMALEYTYADEYLETGIGDICDVVGWNLYIGWYQEDMNKFGPFLDEWHKKYPTKSFIISEYGAGSDTRIHSLTPTRYDYSMEYQELNLESYYKQIMARPFVAGATVWNSFDFNSEGRMDVVPNINNKGVLTLDRKPKDSYFFFQAVLSKEPILKIASTDWKYRTGRAESIQNNFCKQPVVIYSNQAEVELFNNGISLGKKQTIASKAIWDVPFHSGKNQLVARSKDMSDQLDVNFHLQPYLLSDPSFSSIAVNFGSQEYFIEEPIGLVWEPEREYTAGYWGFLKSKEEIYKQPARFDVKGTTSDPLFYAYLKNADMIKFDVAEGHYEVELLFVDQIPGNKFSTLINGNVVYEYPSIQLEKHAVRIKTFIDTKGKEGIKVSFHTLKGSSIISGIKIRKVN